MPRPRSLVRRCSQSGATSMKRGESSNGVDWPAGKMVLDMTLGSVLPVFAQNQRPFTGMLQSENLVPRV